MPLRNLRACRKRGCPELTRDGSGFCEAHRSERAWASNRSESAAKRGYGRPWRRLRDQVMTRARGLCQVCGTAATEVDHIVPKSQGGTDDIDNLQAICRACHKTKTASEAVAARKPTRSEPCRH